MCWLGVVSSQRRAVEGVSSPALWWSWRKPFLPHSTNTVERGLTVMVPVLPPNERFNICFLLFLGCFLLKESKPNKTKFKKKTQKEKLTSG